MQNQRQSTADVLAIQQKYQAEEYAHRREAEMAALGKAFELAGKNQKKLGNTWAELSGCYAEAQAVCAADMLDDKEKQRLLYSIYDAYFAAQLKLSYRQRVLVRTDKYAAKMRGVIKRGGGSLDVKYWLRFALVCIPFLVVGLWGEVVFLDVFFEQMPLWKLLLSFVAFIGGLGGYFYFAIGMESTRVYSGLKRWIRFKLDPGGQAKPTELVEYAKMALPLATAVGSVAIKMYFQ